MGFYHTISAGEGVSSIATAHGLAARTVWDHPKNRPLRRRKDMNVLLPGDRLWIPDREQKQVNCAIDKRHVFRLRGVPVKFRLQVFYMEKHVADAPYLLVVDGDKRRGVTDGQGLIDEFVPPRSQVALVRVDLPDGNPPLLYKFLLGHLNPSDSPSGIVQRLTNLGLVRPLPGQSLPMAVFDALRRLQRDFSLPITGVPDEQTLACLEKLHDTPQAMP